MIKNSDGDLLLVGLDCVIFRFDEQELKAFIVKKKETAEKKWSLVSGFIKHGECPEHAASRVLMSLTGIHDVYMEQIYCLGGVNGDNSPGISIGYVALTRMSDYDDKLLDRYNAGWYPLNEIPQLIFNHIELIVTARKYLQEKALNHPIAFELLPRKFTLTQLQNLYEAIYDTSFDRSNFTKKILSLGVLNKLNEKEKEHSRRGAHYFVLDKSCHSRLCTPRPNFI